MCYLLSSVFVERHITRLVSHGECLLGTAHLRFICVHVSAIAGFHRRVPVCARGGLQFAYPIACQMKDTLVPQF